MNRKIILFFHIEKCGGTSLVQFFRKNYPFQACEAVSRTNVLSKSELKKTLAVYPRLKILSGHNLQVETIDWLRDMGFHVESFSIVRDPIERTVSDFLHDHRKGTFNGQLEDYLNIEWKQNYISRFLGSGDPDSAICNLGKIDNVVELQKSADFVTNLLQNFGMSPSLNYEIANKATGVWPKDIRVQDGVPVGKYKVSERNYQTLLDVSAIDRDLIDRILEKRKPNMQAVSEANSLSSSLMSKTRTAAASAQRNVMYKPLMGCWSKHYSLPRNKIDPRKITSDNAFQ